MSITQNKGEWSELLILLKIIITQRIPLFDRHLEVLTSNNFCIHKIYTPNGYIGLNNSNFVIAINNQVVQTITLESFITSLELNTLGLLIKSEKKSTFSINKNTLDKITAIIDNHPLKSGTNKKSDLMLEMSHSTLMESVKSGFSIKSQIGSPATLLNASQSTNLIYEIKNLDNATTNLINNINTRSKYKDRIKTIYSHGGTISFVKCENSIMEYNLMMIDSNMNNIVAKSLLFYYSNSWINKFSDLTANALSLDMPNDVLQYKFKKFLLAFSLGAFPTTQWNGYYESNGIIILKTDLNYGALHLIYQSELEEYIFNSTKFDTPSSRNNFGYIYEDNGKTYIKLNLQVRYIK